MNAEFNFLEYIIKDQVLIAPKNRVLQLINAVPISFINFHNQLEPPSSAVLALSANSGNDLCSSISCALNCVTDQHLLLEKICNFLEDNDLSDTKMYAKNYIVPGMGHPSIKGDDPRVQRLLNDFGDIAGRRVSFYLRLEKILPVKVNIGGIMCALLLDSGICKENVLFFPLIGRIFGWTQIYWATKKSSNKVLPSHKLINESQQNVF